MLGGHGGGVALRRARFPKQFQIQFPLGFLFDGKDEMCIRDSHLALTLQKMVENKGDCIFRRLLVNGKQSGHRMFDIIHNIYA